jgi:hypothetical protein
MDRQRLRVYLAGPISGCNKTQKLEWRKDIKKRLGNRGYEFIDPTETPWNAQREFIDIDKSDVVIANLWRESIGTVVGIVRARRLAKPVIVVDINHIDSQMLKAITGKEWWVGGLEEAANKLEKEIAPRLRQEPKVRKKNGSVVDFNPRKLRKSIVMACESTEINDDDLPVMVTTRVVTVLRSSVAEVVTTDEIKEEVFRQLEQLSSELDATYRDNFKRSAGRLSEAWSRREQTKKGEDDRDVLYQQQEIELSECRKARGRLETEIASLHQRDVEAGPPSTKAEIASFRNVFDAVLAAEKEFSEFLIIHENAKITAKDCPYQNPQKVYEALKCLADYVQEKFDAQTNPQGTRQMGLSEWWKTHSSIEYTDHESETTLHNRALVRARTIIYKQKTIVLEKHLKLGVGNANNICRIYIENLFEEENKLLIGYVGRHPKSASS